MSFRVGGVKRDRFPPRGGRVGVAFGDVEYNGGPTISCPRIHAAFWGTLWSDPTHQAQAARLVQFLKDVIASDWMNILSQYGAGTGKNSGVFAGQSFNANISGTLTDGAIHAALQVQINSGAIPEPPARNTSDVVVIFLDETVAVKDDNTATMCEPTGDNAFGYHYFFTTVKGNNCYYAVIPALNDVCIWNTCPNQNQIGNNTTSSAPFVTAGNVVFFRGTDNKLWKVNADGSGQLQIGHNTTKSTPFVTPDGWVWFQGTDNKLWKVFNDGSQQSQPRNNTTSSAPTVVGDWVYFQGTDNKLWRLHTDGSAQNQIGNNTTKSTPFVTLDGWVYFQGTDDKLWKVRSDGSGQLQIGHNTTKSTPFVTPDGWVWFQGTDNKLWKVFNDGSQQSQPGNNTTSSSPTVGGIFVYFQGTDNKLWRMKTDGTAQTNLGGNTTASTPAATADSIYFQGTDQTLWRYFFGFFGM
jgi:Domain of unknown function (DUF5050)